MLGGDIKVTLKNMTIPMIVGMVMLMTFSIVDTFFVSMLGTQQLAAISFTFPVTFTVISLNIGLGIGTSAVIAKYIGSGDTEYAKVFGTGALMLSVVLVGFLAIVGYFTIDWVFSLMGATEALMPYIRAYMVTWYFAGVFLALPMVGNAILRASGDTKTPSIIMAAGGGINALLDPILIFGWGPIPAMGIQGAAVATAIAWAISVVWILYLLAIKRGLIEARILSLQEFLSSSRNVLKIGLPAAGANMLTPIAGGVITAVVASYGAEAVAAWGVGNRLESIASIVVLALSMSLPPFISQNYGANQLQRIKLAFDISVRFVVVWQLIVFVILALSADVIANIFANDEKVAEDIKLFLFIVPVAYGLQGIIILANSSFNAMHLPMSALLLSILRLFVCYIPIAYLGSYFYGLEGLFWGCVVANVVTASIAYFWFNNYIKKQMDLVPTLPISEIK
ncbi:MATE family efflux transporter [Glaciecola sp. MH2013]|uniref:MATE family efflux transporter n=1 Tax=Glaciecola sp. MH2013 TaxID=2785524 RepID=UPI00189E179F|nr:MATE family efflux transporter [Glaciecola sp. MH2013]MBF7072486.1 MATE family efflux transporter [Glaciecola sp. MH2013]